jgi:hypothetical protein
MCLTDDINDAQVCAAKLAKEYALAASFGNETEEMLFNLVRMNTLIRMMCRNQVRKITVPVSSSSIIEGQKVCISSLTKTNNMLFLDLTSDPCVTIEIEPCLSDAEICKVVEISKEIVSYS